MNKESGSLSSSGKQQPGIQGREGRPGRGCRHNSPGRDLVPRRLAFWMFPFLTLTVLGLWCS